ncbi:MAG TPA: helix-turn-helix domain-containing protein, partial [Rhizomicrobium sp.]|nr:helix-turn-helix domain-containing protein [Rhizomicrobium sp.]
GGLWFVDTRPDPNDFIELTESALAQFVCGPRKLMGGAQWTTEVNVTHPAPSYRAEYDRVFQVPVVFESGWNALRIDERFMQPHAPILPRYAFSVFTQHAEAMLRDLENSKSIRGRVENLLMPVLHKGDTSMDAIAEKLALSRQTLFRKLKAEGTSFEKVLDDLRHKMALDYLGAKKVSVNETAYLVGFSDPAAFSRAFKRWTGKTPSEMRGEKAV